jgi:AcrR family transcriptional regulator
MKFELLENKIYRAALRVFARNGAQKLSVKELAKQAGVARGTIYNNIEDIDNLFEDLATRLTNELTSLINRALTDDIPDPERIAIGIQTFMATAHRDPEWASFMIRFGLTNNNIKALWEGPLNMNLQRGIENSLYKIDRAQIPNVIIMIGCSILGSMQLVKDGHQTYREASGNLVQLVMRALGIKPKDVEKLSKKISKIDLNLA